VNAAVAEAIEELTDKLRESLKTTKTADDAVLAVVGEAFRETEAIRFEGNNYSSEWVDEAARRGLPNLRRTPEAAEQLVSEQSRALLTGLGILDEAELESRYHVRIERYVKDMLIELHTLEQIAETMILPAAYSYLCGLASGAAQAKAAGVHAAPLIAAANRASDMVAELQNAHDALETAIVKVEGMHDAPVEQARFLTADGADAMAAVRRAADALELTVADADWPLPKYREMLFPV